MVVNLPQSRQWRGNYWIGDGDAQISTNTSYKGFKLGLDPARNLQINIQTVQGLTLYNTGCVGSQDRQGLPPPNISQNFYKKSLNNMTMYIVYTA